MININDFKPELVGRGEWKVMHTGVARAVNLDDRRFAIRVIRLVVNNLSCAICYEHAINYLSEYPPENYAYSTEALFEWLYYFHQAANEHSGKHSFPTLEEVRQFYFYNTEKCTEGCGVIHSDEPVKNYID